jgi:hypothetical protein
MQGMEHFDTTLTLCFTPEHLGISPHYTSPPKSPKGFAEFAEWAVARYVPRKSRPLKQDSVEVNQHA